MRAGAIRVLLLHVLVADLRRLAIHAHADGNTDTLMPLLDVMASGLLAGDAAVLNAVTVSFVEDTGCWDTELAGFISAWPAALRAEADRQRAWRLKAPQ